MIMNLVMVFILAITLSINAQNDFIYEEGSIQVQDKTQKQTIASTSTKTQSQTVVPVQTQDIKKQQDVVIKQERPTQVTLPSRVEESQDIPKSYYRAFIDNMKMGALIGLIISLVLLIFVQNWAIVFPGFPIIWFITTIVMIFITSC